MIKRVGLFIISFALVTSSFSQTHTAKKAATPQTPGGSLATDKQKMLIKAWVIDTVGNFGVFSVASAKEKNDGITFIADGSLFLTQEGAAITGTWKYAGGRIMVDTKNPDDAKGYYGNKINFKMLSLADSRLVLEFQTPDLIRIQYIYKPKK